MEADWEVEIGAGAPVIEAHWSGFIDLRAHPEQVAELCECRELPGLADALLRLNAIGSGVWTSKTDVFTPERIDPDEMNASREESSHAVSCYVDVLFGDEAWDGLSKAKQECAELCAKLQSVVLDCRRVDVVIRRALIGDLSSLGATVYLTGCGRTPIAAKERLGECLDAFARIMVPR